MVASISSFGVCQNLRRYNLLHSLGLDLREHAGDDAHVQFKLNGVKSKDRMLIASNLVAIQSGLHCQRQQ
jgi:hypothetical protein